MSRLPLPEPSHTDEPGLRPATSMSLPRSKVPDSSPGCPIHSDEIKGTCGHLFGIRIRRGTSAHGIIHYAECTNNAPHGLRSEVRVSRHDLRSHPRAQCRRCAGGVAGGKQAIQRLIVGCQQVKTVGIPTAPRLSLAAFRHLRAPLQVSMAMPYPTFWLSL